MIVVSSALTAQIFEHLNFFCARQGKIGGIYHTTALLSFVRYMIIYQNNTRKSGPLASGGQVVVTFAVTKCKADF